MDVVGLRESQAEEMQEFIGQSDARDVILDLHGTRPFDWQMQRLSVELWTAVRLKGGTMAICFI